MGELRGDSGRRRGGGRGEGGEEDFSVVEMQLLEAFAPVQGTISCGVAGYLPDEGFSRLHKGELLSACAPPSPCVFPLASSLISSSSLSALSSAADSLSDGSGEVTLTSTLISPGWGCCAGASEWQEEEEEGGGGVCVSGSRAAAGAGSALESSAGEPSAAPAASFCFWSCSFCRLLCFLRNLARRFLNHTWQAGLENELLCNYLL